MNSLLLTAKEFEKNREWQNALGIYASLSKEHPQTINFLEKIGWCQSRLDRFEDAILTFKSLRKIKNSAKIDYMIGYQYYMLKDWKNAVSWFEESVKVHPQYFIARYRLGKALIESCGKTMRLKNINFLKAFNELTNAEEIYNSMDENNKIINRSTYAKVCFQKGKIFLERNDWLNAIKYFNIALDIDPKDKNYNYGLAKAYHNFGEHLKALEIIEKIRNVYYIEELKASLYKKVSRHEDALATLLNLVSWRKKDYLYREIAEIYLEVNKNQEALKYINLALNQNPKNHKNFYVLGILYFNLGFYLNSKKFLSEAINCKQEKYKSEYLDASKLLNKINEIIASNENRYDIGKVKDYKGEKGFGFIEDNINTIFFHISNVEEKCRLYVRKDIIVNYKTKATDKGLSATDISIL